MHHRVIWTKLVYILSLLSINVWLIWQLCFICSGFSLLIIGRVKEVKHIIKCYVQIIMYPYKNFNGDLINLPAKFPNWRLIVLAQKTADVINNTCSNINLTMLVKGAHYSFSEILQLKLVPHSNLTFPTKKPYLPDIKKIPACPIRLHILGLNMLIYEYIFAFDL